MYEAYTTVNRSKDIDEEHIHGYFFYEGNAKIFAEAFNRGCGYSGNMQIRKTQNALLRQI